MSTPEVSNENEIYEEMGPIDYVVIEWPGRQPKGDGAPMVLDLHDKGIIRILDAAVMIKEEDGTVTGLDLDADDMVGEISEFAGAATGLLGVEDIEEAANALEPGTSALVLVWENRWAAPLATTWRRSGGQLVASGRIPVQAILAALEAVEGSDSSEE